MVLLVPGPAVLLTDQPPDGTLVLVRPEKGAHPRRGGSDQDWP